MSNTRETSLPVPPPQTVRTFSFLPPISTDGNEKSLHFIATQTPYGNVRYHTTEAQNRKPECVHLRESRNRVEADESIGEVIDHSFTIGAERNEDLGVGEASSEFEYTREGCTWKFMLRMRDREGNELVWGW